MKTEIKVLEGWQYVCRHCKLVYQVYGSRLLCDNCNRKLQLIPPGEVTQLLKKWEVNIK